MKRRHTPVWKFARAATLALLGVGCGLEATPSLTTLDAPNVEACAVAVDAVPWQLTAKDVAGLGLEPTTARVKVATPCEAATRDPAVALQNVTDDELARLGAEDPAWRAADGTRYEAMLVLADGTAFGRKGAAPDAKLPSDENRFGAFEGALPTDAMVQDAILRLERGEGDGVIGEEAPRKHTRGILGDELADDRRVRVTSTTTLTGYPFRTIGALNGTSGAGFTGCTGTRVGPRHVLTAAHCVLSEGGTWTTSGWFHPGQTNSTHPNGAAVSWSGVYARDYRVSRRWDYALLYLQDRADSTSLGWMGVRWWNSASSYNGLLASLYGYPSKTGSGTSDCQASVLSNKNCDGWMYGHSDILDSDAFRSDEQLEYDIDTGPAQSGSAVWRNNEVLGVHWGCAAFGGCSGDGRNRAARFRQNMWNDVCSWISEVDSAFGSHSLCP